MDKQVQDKKQRTDKAFALCGVIGRFWRRLHPSRPKCKEGRLWQTKLHMFNLKTNINIYECDRCKNEFI